MGSLFVRERCNFRTGRRGDEPAHEKITAMNFENHRGFGRNSASIVAQCCFVGRTDFAQCRAG